MSFLTFLFLCTAFIQSFLHFHVLQANHVAFMILTSILYCFTETLIIFFYVGTGVSIKEYTQEHHLPSTFHKNSIPIKRKIYPPLLSNLLFMIILFVTVGAVDTQRLPAWVYQVGFLICIADYVRVKWIQNECFRANTKNILEMSGIADHSLCSSSAR